MRYECNKLFSFIPAFHMLSIYPPYRDFLFGKYEGIIEHPSGKFVNSFVEQTLDRDLMSDEPVIGADEELSREAAVVARVRSGDESQYAVLVNAYQRRIFHFIRGMVRNNEDAEDLTQEVFVRAFFNIRSLKNDSSFKSWLFRIAYNLTLDFVRKKRPKVVDTEDSVRESYVDMSNPKTELSRDHIKSHVKRCLDMLNEQQRNILVLCDLEGLSYQEISDALGIPFGTVQSRIFYARQKLKERLLATGITEADLI